MSRKSQASEQAEQSTPLSFSRREVLYRLLGWAWMLPAAFGSRLILGFLRYEPPANRVTHFSLGPLSLLTRLPAYSEAGQVWLHQDEAGYYAVDAICTHLGCAVDLEPSQGYSCPCHGSRFGLNGDVLRGPATRPLPFLRLYLNGGRLTVDRAEAVEGTFRLKR
jgi:nitrite reductase/ring-hydroxylating ferredoxin subunit